MEAANLLSAFDKQSTNSKIMSLEVSQPQVQLNPWTSMWLSPRKTINYLLGGDKLRNGLLVVILFGVTNGLCTGIDDPSISIGGILLSGALGGLISVTLLSWLVTFSGKLLGGKANRKQIWAALAWALVPIVWTLPLWLLLLVLVADGSFADLSNILFELFSLATLVATLWSLVVGVAAISQVQGFTVPRAIVNAILAPILAAVVVVVIALPIALLFSAIFNI